ncbi:MAG: YabP/YqfC family sporulation protein [Anaerovoracaceae bacterium]
MKEIAVGIKDEILYDFSLNMPRVLIGGGTGIVDNVKQIVMINDKEIVVNCGGMYASISGDDLMINSLNDRRIILTGRIFKLELYQAVRGET